MTKDQLIAAIQRGLAKANELLAKLKSMHENNRVRLYKTAVSYIGTDVTPSDIIPDELDCANTVNTLHIRAFGYAIGGGASTWLLHKALQHSPYFTKVDIPLPGDIVISPSGHGNGKLSNGHVGIVDYNEMICPIRRWGPIKVNSS